MNYEFPIIRHINDVLEHVAGRKEFRVDRQQHYTVILYKWLDNDTFKMNGPDDLAGAIRRECRGLMFDKAGLLISRPFHKFFNIGEKPETFPSEIDVNRISHYEDKMDGSMVRPVRINGEIHWCTKGGITDISRDVRVWIEDGRQQFDDYAAAMIDIGFTPIFEWTSPDNRIVLKYDQRNLTLLAVRDNLTGRYTDLRLGFTLSKFVNRHKYPDANYLAPTDHAKTEFVFSHRVRAGIELFMHGIFNSKDIEGFVVVMEDGHRFKIKTEEYCKIHRIISDIHYDHYIGQFIMDDMIDDIRPFLSAENMAKVNQYEAWFRAGIRSKIDQITDLKTQLTPLSRKDAAALLREHDTFTKSIVFRTLDGDDPEEATLSLVAKNVANQDKHAQLKKWLGGAS